MQFGIINVPVTDMRAEPDSTSERKSQALFGTPVEVGQGRNGFVRVKLLDKYSGWSRIGQIKMVSQSDWEKYIARPKQKIKSESVIIKSGPGAATHPFRLFFGTELVITPHNGQVCFAIPGGIKTPIGTRCLLPTKERQNKTVTGKQLLTTATRFIGVPYLWGGITPYGYDCSGLVQAVYGFHGITLPRDSKDQTNVGAEVDRNELKAGDLLFFPGHVAFSCGGDEILHASASRGMVTFDSLDPKAINYRKDIDKDFLIARRPWS